MGEYFVDIIEKSHVEHFVGFVKDDCVHGSEFYFAALYKVDKSARCGYHYLYTLAECTYLALDARSAIYGEDAKTIYIF
jgi:hypothetical protein